MFYVNLVSLACSGFLLGSCLWWAEMRRWGCVVSYAVLAFCAGAVAVWGLLAN